MANDDSRRLLNPRTIQSLRGTPRPGGTPKPGGKLSRQVGGTPKPGGKLSPQSADVDQPLEAIGGEEDEGEARPLVFAERLKSGYSAARNDQLEKLWKQPERLAKKGEPKWEPLGPDNLGGRVTCLIATDPTEPTEPAPKRNSLLAGAACGGLWGGTVEDCRQQGKQKESPSAPNLQCEWKPNQGSESFPLLHNIGALAITGKTIYCGTGHAYAAGDSFPGVGLFRLELKDCTITNCEQIAKAGEKFPHRISTIAVDGSDVWIGGVDLPEEQEEESSEAKRDGIFHSKNPSDPNGWERVSFKLAPKFAERMAVCDEGTFEGGIFKDRDYQCHSIVFLKNSEGEEVMLAAITAPLDWGGIWLSTNRGDTWEQLKRGLPSPREFGRTSLAVAKTDDKTVYAFVGATDGRCLGVFRSRDGGKHWVSHNVEHFAACGSLNYVNCLAVSPTDPDLVICGARDLHRSTDGGQTWTQVTEWFAAPDSTGYSHADHHALLWPHKERLYSANDGGVDVSHDGGVTWRNLTNGLEIAMFYDIDVAASFPPRAPDPKGIPNLIIAGGTQDNASVMTDFRASGIGYVPTCSGLQVGVTHDMAKELTELSRKPDLICNFDASGISNIAHESELKLLLPLKVVPSTAKLAGNFVDILDGDGGWTVFDPKDALHVYGSSQNMTIYRHRRDNGWQEVTPANASDEERNKTWMAIIAMHPTDPNIIFTGSTRVWRTKNDGVDWTPVSPELDGTPITAIEIADDDTNFIYVGTAGGNIFKSTDGGNRWTDEPGEDRPKPMEWRTALRERLTIGVARTITRIEAHPKDKSKIAVTLMGFIAENQPLPNVLWFDGNDWSDLSGSDDLTRSGGDKHPLLPPSPPNPLPNVHYNVVTWDEKGDYLFVGNDVGVWALQIPGGEVKKTEKYYDWKDISAGLPSTLVTDLVYHHRTNSLTAATYGRSLWWAGEQIWKKKKTAE